MLKRPKLKRETVRQRVEREERQRKYDYEQGLKDGLTQAEKKAKDDLRLKLVEANIKLAQQLGQMVEATARAVITFIGEGGVR